MRRGAVRANPMNRAMPTHQQYAIDRPLRDPETLRLNERQWKRGTCQEADCPSFYGGFKLVMPEGCQQDRKAQADRTREYKRVVLPGQQDGHKMVEFLYPLGTQCFKVHIVPNGRGVDLRHQYADKIRFLDDDEWKDRVATDLYRGFKVRKEGQY